MSTDSPTSASAPPTDSPPLTPPSRAELSREARHRARRAAILEAAREVFRRKTIREAKMEEIAAAAGLSVGGLYWYYRGKNELLAEMLSGVYDADLPRVMAIADSGGAARDRLQQLADLMERKHLQTRDTLRVALEYCQTAISEEEAVQGWQSYAGVYRGAIAKILDDGLKAGDFISHDAKALADAIWSMYDGLNVLWLMHGESMDFARSFREGFARILNGLDPGGGTQDA